MTETQINQALDEIVKRISSRFSPEKILLFGSLVRGTATRDSDADLLIVMKPSGSRRKQALEIDLALQGIPIPTDIIVVTPQDFDQCRNMPNTVIYEAVHQGKVLYDHAA